MLRQDLAAGLLVERLRLALGQAGADVRQAVRQEVDRVQPLRPIAERRVEGVVHIRVTLRLDGGHRRGHAGRGGRRVVVEPAAVVAEQVRHLVGEQDHLELLQLRQAAHELQQGLADARPLVRGRRVLVHQLHAARHVHQEHDALAGQGDALEARVGGPLSLRQFAGHIPLLGLGVGERAAVRLQVAVALVQVVFQGLHPGLGGGEALARLGGVGVGGRLEPGQPLFGPGELVGQVRRPAGGGLLLGGLGPQQRFQIGDALQCVHHLLG